MRHVPSAAAPSKRPRASTKRLLALAAGALLAAGVAGCAGTSSSPGSSADPAGVVPASAAMYIAALVRPEGSQSSEALAAGAALTHQANPYLRLLAVLQTPGSPQLKFSTEVAPWLGRTAGLYLSSLAGSSDALSLIEHGVLGIGSAAGSYPFGPGGAQGAVVMDTRDSAKALSFLQRQAARAGALAASYHGTSYQATASGLAFALVHRLAVIGSVSGVQAVIDTAASGGALSGSPQYSLLLAHAPAGRIANVYYKPSAAGAAPQALSSLLGVLSAGRVTNVSLLAGTSSLTLDADTIGPSESGALLSSDPRAAGALAALPGESWLALGLPSVGSQLQGDVAELHALVGLTGSLGGSSEPAAAGLSIGSLLSGVLEPLEILGARSAQARRAFGSWIGPIGVFAAGTGLLELKAGLVIDSSNATLSKAAVPLLAAQLRARGATIQSVQVPGAQAAVGAQIKGVPLTLVIADGVDSAGKAKLVLGLGAASVSEALNPQSTLAGTSTLQAAASAIGEGTQPSLILQVPTLLGLLEGIGLTSGESIAPLVPYLRAITSVSGGGHQLAGELQRYRLVLGLSRSGA